MDRPGNPGNLGTLIRSCDALGASGLVVTGHAVDLYDPATITASRGSIFALPVVQAASHAEVLQWVASVRERLGRCDLVGTDEHADTDLAAHDFTAPTVLVVGNETHGLSRAYRDACDAVVRIPMSGSASSLNVSVAASIAIYEVVRQRAGDAGLLRDDRPKTVGATDRLDYHRRCEAPTERRRRGTQSRPGERDVRFGRQRQPSADAVSRHARTAAAWARARPQRDPGRARRRLRRVHHLALHDGDRRHLLPVGRGAERDGAVLPQHGDRALHAGHRRDRGGRVRAFLEAVGRAVLSVHDPAEHVAWLGHQRRDHPGLPGGSHRRAAGDHRRARRLGRGPHRLPHRLSDARARAVLQGGPDARVSGHRDRRRHQPLGVGRAAEGRHRLRPPSSLRARFRSR